MSTTEQDGPTWFLARDGQQYGPITSLEMIKIIELGQLADTDLVWNDTLTEWSPAQVAIDALTPPRPQPVRPPEPQPPLRSGAAGPSAAAGGPDPRGPRPSGMADYPAGAGSYKPDAAAYPDQSTAGPRRDGRGDAFGREAYGRPAAGAHDPAAGPAAQPGQDRAAYADARTQSGRSGAARPRQADAASRPVATDTRRRDLATSSPEFDDDDDEGRDSGGGVALKAIAAGVLIALIGGGGWFAYQNRASLMAMVDQSGASAANAPIIRASESAPSGNQPALRTTNVSTNSTATTARPAFLDTVAWQSASQVFPQWASEREEQASSMLQSGQDQGDVRKYLIDEIAQLRRQHANDALAASPTALRSVATAFLSNLRTLTGRSPQICYAFISKGETSPQILPLLDDTVVSEPLLKQMHTVIDAISDGRTSPQTYLPPRQSDYSMISTELSKMGWTGSDMRLFGDPQKLAEAPPEKVCQLVTDWFTAQLMITDQAIQSRLLVQSLRPVVAG